MKEIIKLFCLILVTVFLFVQLGRGETMKVQYYECDMCGNKSASVRVLMATKLETHGMGQNLDTSDFHTEVCGRCFTAVKIVVEAMCRKQENANENK